MNNKMFRCIILLLTVQWYALFAQEGNLSTYQIEDVVVDGNAWIRALSQLGRHLSKKQSPGNLQTFNYGNAQLLQQITCNDTPVQLDREYGWYLTNSLSIKKKKIEDESFFFHFISEYNARSFRFCTEVPIPALSLCIADYEAAAIDTARICYTAYYIKGHDDFKKSIRLPGHKIAGLLAEVTEDFERNNRQGAYRFQLTQENMQTSFSLTLNEVKEPGWQTLGTCTLHEGDVAFSLTNDSELRYVAADAVKLVRIR